MAQLSTLGLTPRAMNSPLLPELSLAPGDYGWTGQLPEEIHRLFGREIGVEIHTREVPDDPKVLPPVSQSQAALVGSIKISLPAILKRVEAEMVEYNQKFDPDFRGFIKRPHIWLRSSKDDGMSWTFVIGRTYNPDFGYHAEFKGTEFVELWSGD